MSLERIRKLVRSFDATFADDQGPAPDGPAWPHDPALGRELLESMLLVRHLDVAAHELRGAGHGHYTICSTGHEANVVVGRLTGPADPALLHYRSAAVQVERARHVPGHDAVGHIALSLVASADDPMSGGRHKVFGHPALGIQPSTSTIASHLPRAIGMAFAIARRPKLGLPPATSADAIAVASMGDASLNHSTAIGALNAASWTLHQSMALPLLVVVEDNGLGISTRTPDGWVATRLAALPHVRVFTADGSDLAAAWAVAAEAVGYVRTRRKAAVLHLRTVRLLGHAGSDVDTTYRTGAEIAAQEALDPVLGAAWQLVRAGGLSRAGVLALSQAAAARVQAAADAAVASPRLRDRAVVMASLVRPLAPAHQAGSEDLAGLGAGSGTALTLAQGVNAALAEQLAGHDDVLIFGEDVAKKGGVYGLTKGLLAKAGPARVFNTLLDEQTILGLALGASSMGLLPVPEIQYLAYLHNAEDQLRGEAATLPYFSDGKLSNPMVVRIAGFGYQKGFGGHFHNDNSIAVLRDLPGIAVAVPARGDDALALARAAFALARQARRVVVLIEPIALYHSRDLHQDGDGLWLASDATSHIASHGAASGAETGAAAFGRARVYDVVPRQGAGTAASRPALAIASYANGLWMSLRVAQRLADELSIAVRVLDLRWLVPLPLQDVLAAAAASGKLLVVDECRTSAGVHEAVAAALLESLQAPSAAPVRYGRVSSADCFIPLGDAANLVLLGEDEIEAAARALLREA